MSLLDELLEFISQGSIAGFPPIAVMAVPFVLGLIVGFFIKKALKIAIIAGLAIAAVTYFGMSNLGLEGLKDIIARYGPQALHYAIILVAMVPLSLGFVIGLVIGFLLG